MPPKDRASVLHRASLLVSDGDPDRARALLAEHYPFRERTADGCRCVPGDALSVFRRDGFVDRYSGERLVYPAALYALARLLPDALPLGAGRSRSHDAHWDLFPTVDHVVPLCRGGEDEASNRVTTAVTRHVAKSSATLEELGWTLHQPGDFSAWDGLCGWYLSMVPRHPEFATLPANRGWHEALVQGMH